MATSCGFESHRPHQPSLSERVKAVAPKPLREGDIVVSAANVRPLSKKLASALDRLESIIEPPRGDDEEAKKVPNVCSSLDMALEHLDNDCEFLTRGGVFSNDMIDAYITLKMEEVTRFRMTTHPVEFDMYYSA